MEGTSDTKAELAKDLEEQRLWGAEDNELQDDLYLCDSLGNTLPYSVHDEVQDDTYLEDLFATPPSQNSRAVDLSSGRDANSSDSFSESDDQAFDNDTFPELRPTKTLEVKLLNSTLINPRSLYDGWTPPLGLTVVSEPVAFESLMAYVESLSDASQNRQDFVEFELDDFAVYVKPNGRSPELRALQNLATRQHHDHFYFDGILSIGNVKHYVQEVLFKELPIGNYGRSFSSVGDQIWIRSAFNSHQEVYYQLKTPAAEYARFHEPFLWLVDFAKHVVDFCASRIRKDRQVSLRHFQQHFIDRLRKIHKKNAIFQRWQAQHGGSDDYRSSLVAHVDFIWKEVYGVLGSKDARSLQIFKEIKFFNQYKSFSVLNLNNDSVAPTIVTPYIYRCFGHMRLGRLLTSLDRHGDCVNGQAVEASIPQGTLLRSIESTPQKITARRPSVLGLSEHATLVTSIKPGDTISTPPDGEGTGTKWRREAAEGFVDDNRWFGLVQRVHISKTAARTFDVTWLYRPIDTPCCRMKYPWDKELFLSDHCTCEDGRSARVKEDQVLDKHVVDWFGSPESSTAEFFIRQTYLTKDRRWVALERSQIKCNHETLPEDFKVGQTVLAEVEKQDVAEAFEVVGNHREGTKHVLRLRRLCQRRLIDKPHARPNELVYTDQLVDVNADCIVGKCVVRFFHADATIPSPYNRNGTANLFFFSHKLEFLNGEQVCMPLDNSPSSLIQGFDPKQCQQKLKGLDLFCGSGNFGRGLEEGNAVEMRWTNDIWDKAVHTYMANTPCNTRPFLGSVDDLLQRAIKGKYSDCVPKPGEVDFIAGGSPCQGFSLLTDDKTCNRQVKNRSLVASFASFVDFYRPKYGILENVPNIVQKGNNRAEDVLSQLVCAIVGMGYQVQITLGDAWSFGAPQMRTRVFLYFAAPGHRLPTAPLPSHSHFDGVQGRRLGTMANGESYVVRSFEPTAFKFVSAGEATADLPDIYDAKGDCCVPFPDHRLSLGLTPRLRDQIKQIPTRPYGMNFVKAWNQSPHRSITEAERSLFPEKGLRVTHVSKGWGRIQPGDVFPTITTCCSPTDARIGNKLHWQQHRPITIMEARRAQGFLDHEVLLGSPAEQWKLVGNSVARQMALALGLQFREAWLGSLYDNVASADPVAATNGMTDLTVGEVDEDDWTAALVGSAISSMGATPDSVDSLLSRDHFDVTPPTSASEAAAAQYGPSRLTRKRPLEMVERYKPKMRRVSQDRQPSVSGTEGTDRVAAWETGSEQTMSGQEWAETHDQNGSAAINGGQEVFQLPFVEDEDGFA